VLEELAASSAVVVIAPQQQQQQEEQVATTAQAQEQQQQAKEEEQPAADTDQATTTAPEEITSAHLDLILHALLGHKSSSDNETTTLTLLRKCAQLSFRSWTEQELAHYTQSAISYLFNVRVLLHDDSYTNYN